MGRQERHIEEIFQDEKGNLFRLDGFPVIGKPVSPIRRVEIEEGTPKIDGLLKRLPRRECASEGKITIVEDIPVNADAVLFSKKLEEKHYVGESCEGRQPHYTYGVFAYQFYNIQ